MHYYIYHYIHIECNDNKTSDKELTLYAFTDKKNYAKRFEKERDMNQFKKKIVDLSSDQIKYLLDEYSHCDLIPLRIEIYDEKTNSSFHKKFMVTKNENNHFTSNKFMGETNLYTHCWTPPFIFKKKIQKALDDIGYTYGFNYVSGEIDISKPSGDFNSTVYSFFMKNFCKREKTLFKMNEYNILFNIIGDTLK